MKRPIPLLLCLTMIVGISALSDETGATGFDLLGRAEHGDHLYHNEIPFKVYYAADYWSVALRVDSGQISAIYYEDLIGKKGTSLHMLAFLGNSQKVPDKTKVAEVIVRYVGGATAKVDLVAGYNIAEWAYDRPGVEWQFKHSKPAPGYSWYEGDGLPPEISSAYGRYIANMYYVRLPLQYKALDSLELRWTAGTGYDPVSGSHAALWINALTLADEPWREISAHLKLQSGFHTAAIKSDGTLWAWGNNYLGQCGDNTTIDIPYPQKIGTDTNWVSVSAGDFHTVAIKSDGTLWAWGDNHSGQLGDGTRGEGTLIPKKIGTNTNWVKVSAGSYHTLAIKSDGTLWAWGDNYYGQLGDGTVVQSDRPKRVGDDNAWVEASARNLSSFGIKSDGTLWTWGNNQFGQLGDGSKIHRYEPKQIGIDRDNWIKVLVGGRHTLGIMSDNYKPADAIIHNTTLWAWGENDYGQLGDGTKVDSLFPKRIGTKKHWKAVSAGFTHTVGLLSDGTLWAWGDNYFGQLGDGTGTSSRVPKQIGKNTDWVKVAVGSISSFAAKSDGTIWAWGLNDHGQLGDGTKDDRNQPVKIFPPVRKNASIGAVNILLLFESAR